MMRLGLICAGALLIAAAPARAATVNVWSCHGPDGSPASAFLFNGSATAGQGGVTGACTTNADFVRAGYITTPVSAGSFASITYTVPSMTGLTAVAIGRDAIGPGYTATRGATQLEFSDGAATAKTGELVLPPTPGDIVLGVTCAGVAPATCPNADQHVGVHYIRLMLDDSTPPGVAISGLPGTVSGTVNVSVTGTDAGAGVASMRATVDGSDLATGTFAGCVDLPGGGEHDLAVGMCPATAPFLPFALDSTRYSDGSHLLVVTVTDGGGNVGTANQMFTAANGTATPMPNPTASPAPTAAPTAVPTATPTPTPEPDSTDTSDVVTIPKKIVASVSSKVSFTVSCPKAAKARCTLRFTSAGTRLATGNGSIAPGKRGKITLTLTSSARRTLKRRGTLKGTLSLYEGTKKRPGVTVTLRLK